MGNFEKQVQGMVESENEEIKVEGYYICESKEETCLNDCPFSSSIWTTDH